MTYWNLLLQCIFVFGLLAERFGCSLMDDHDIRARMEEKAVSSISFKALEEIAEKRHYLPNNTPNLLALHSKLKSHIRRVLSEQNSSEQPVHDGSTLVVNYAYPHDTYSTNRDYGSPPIDMIADASSGIPSYYEKAVLRNDRENPDDFSSGENESSMDLISADDYYANRQGRGRSQDESKREFPESSTRKQDPCKTTIQEAKETNEGKSIVISKECEYPEGDGPDAQIYNSFSNSHAQAPADTQKKVASPNPLYPNEQDELKNERSGDSIEKLSDFQTSGTKLRNPLQEDYIDKMFATHFKSFPSFKFNLPYTTKNQAVATESVEFHNNDKKTKPMYVREKYTDEHADTSVTKNLKEQQDYNGGDSSVLPEGLVRVVDYNEKDSIYGQYEPKRSQETYAEEKKRREGLEGRPNDQPVNDDSKPKAMKKSFAYYRLANPKDDPNNREYAEEYAHGNYRSFSTSYDSERDGPK